MSIATERTILADGYVVHKTTLTSRNGQSLLSRTFDTPEEANKWVQSIEAKDLDFISDSQLRTEALYSLTLSRHRGESFASTKTGHSSDENESIPSSAGSTTSSSGVTSLFSAPLSAGGARRVAGAPPRYLEQSLHFDDDEFPPGPQPRGPEPFPAAQRQYLLALLDGRINRKNSGTACVSRYPGVSFAAHCGKYRVGIPHAGGKNNSYVGKYDSLEDAEEAWETRVRQLFSGLASGGASAASSRPNSRPSSRAGARSDYADVDGSEIAYFSLSSSASEGASTASGFGSASAAPPVAPPTATGKRAPKQATTQVAKRARSKSPAPTQLPSSSLAPLPPPHSFVFAQPQGGMQHPLAAPPLPQPQHSFSCGYGDGTASADEQSHNASLVMMPGSGAPVTSDELQAALSLLISHNGPAGAPAATPTPHQHLQQPLTPQPILTIPQHLQRPVPMMYPPAAGLTFPLPQTAATAASAGASHPVAPPFFGYGLGANVFGSAFAPTGTGGAGAFPSFASSFAASAFGAGMAASLGNGAFGMLPPYMGMGSATPQPAAVAAAMYMPYPQQYYQQYYQQLLNLNAGVGFGVSGVTGNYHTGAAGSAAAPQLNPPSAAAYTAPPHGLLLSYDGHSGGSGNSPTAGSGAGTLPERPIPYYAPLPQMQTSGTAASGPNLKLESI